MQIQNGKLYENKTWLYLYPSLRFYGDDLMDWLGQFFKLGTGVGDVNVKKKDNCIFILFHLELPFSEKRSLEYKEKFEKFLSWLSYKPYYVKDYVYDAEQHQHMVVLKLPKTINSAYLDFVAGRYSKMYTQKQIEYFFNIIETSKEPAIVNRNERYKKVRQVFSKDKKLLPIFVDSVNKRFKTKVPIEEFTNAELDYPPNKKEEIFNYGTRTKT